MKAAMQFFYTLLLWLTSFELAIAKNAPERNHDNIEALQQDVSEYERALLRLELGL